MQNFNEGEFITITNINDKPFRLVKIGGEVVTDKLMEFSGTVIYNRPVFKNKIYADRKIGVKENNGDEALTWFMLSQIMKIRS